MLIVCPSCATSYMIDPAALGPAGRSVRCARCRTTWFAGGPQSPPEAEPRGVIKDKRRAEFVDHLIAEAQEPAAETQPPPSDRQAEQHTGENNASGGKGDDASPESEQSAPPAIPEPGLPRAEPFAPAPADADEQPQAIADAPTLVPPIEHDAAQPAAPSDTEDVESYAARRLRMQSRRKRSRRSSRWTAILMVLFALNVSLIGARNEVVRYLPQTASLFSAIGLPVNLRHLDFENVRITREAADGTAILVVQGSIVSTARNPVEVPRLRFAARNKAGQEIYTWSMKPDRSMLQPGERLAFQSRLASPPKDAHDVMVRFFTANDAMAGGK
jgi:predicted Zn finger-like uncharacterized protein